jgi:hypothetical protein
MRHFLVALALLVPLVAAVPAPAAAAAPDYSAWNQLLERYYNPEKGMDYKALKAKDKAALDQLRRQMATVDPAALSKEDRLAYWINLYNINVVGIVVDNYPVESIRDLSTDPIVRLNVFKKDSVAIKGGKTSLDKIENEKIRGVYKDARIHFAINCAAASCPPIRPEAYVGAKVNAQLDDQADKFLNGPNGVRFTKKGDTLVVRTTKIMDWFGDDFEKWGGGKIAFLKKHLTPQRLTILNSSKDVDLDYDDYSWKLNDWKR